MPFRDLTPEERDIVFHGPAEKKHILYKAKKGDNFAELDFTYYNAVYTVENALAKAKDEKGLARVARFLTEGPCPDCEGTRLSAAARGPLVRGINLAKACEMTLDEAVSWVDDVAGMAGRRPAPHGDFRLRVASSETARQAGVELGLGCTGRSIARRSDAAPPANARACSWHAPARNRTTRRGFTVLDEPSIGLHPANIRTACWASCATCWPTATRW